MVLASHAVGAARCVQINVYMPNATNTYNTIPYLHLTAINWSLIEKSSINWNELNRIVAMHVYIIKDNFDIARL